MNEWRADEDVLLQNPLLPLGARSRVLAVPVFGDGAGRAVWGHPTAAEGRHEAARPGRSCSCTGCSPRTRTEQTLITSLQHILWTLLSAQPLPDRLADSLYSHPVACFRGSVLLTDPSSTDLLLPVIAAAGAGPGGSGSMTSPCLPQGIGAQMDT